MFKAQLISSPDYHQLQRKSMIISLIVLPFIVWINPLQISLWCWIILTLVGNIGIYRLEKTIGLKLAEITRDRIEIDYERIVIKDQLGKIKEEIPIATTKNNMVKEAYLIPGDEIEDMYN